MDEELAYALKRVQAEERQAGQVLKIDRLEGGAQDQLQRVLSLLGDLEKVTTVLAEKLDPALVPLADESAKAPPMPRPHPPTRWAAHLENVGDRTQQIRDALADLARRVDL